MRPLGRLNQLYSEGCQKRFAAGHFAGAWAHLLELKHNYEYIHVGSRDRKKERNWRIGRKGISGKHCRMRMDGAFGLGVMDNPIPKSAWGTYVLLKTLSEIVEKDSSLPVKLKDGMIIAIEDLFYRVEIKETKN